MEKKPSHKIESAGQRLTTIQKGIEVQDLWISTIEKRMEKDRERLDRARSRRDELDNERAEIEAYLVAVRSSGRDTIH
jgi:hypothetical protein